MRLDNSSDALVTLFGRCFDDEMVKIIPFPPQELAEG
jgi:hypothetical protein